ncbi:MAG: hypothetical protein IPP90_21115 [Gemmatimonadaceae bacterium]|nr:hypothetical protein [Gemmatimonadaceae bacterium]
MLRRPRAQAGAESVVAAAVRADCRLRATLADNGVIVRSMLHVSREEQAGGFRERLDDPRKNWKFRVDDLKDRGCGTTTRRPTARR